MDLISGTGGLRRDARRWRAVRGPAAGYALLTLLAFPVLELLLAQDQAIQVAHDVFDDDAPRLFTIAADWLAHGPSFWNPHVMAGNHLFGMYALPVTSPDVLLSAVLPPFLAYGLTVALAAFVAGLGTHRFLRESLALAPAACAVGGTLAALGFWHYVNGVGAALLPWLLWSTDRMLRDPGRRTSVLGAVLLAAAAILAGLLQIAAFQGAAVLAWVVLTSPGRAAAVRRGTRVVLAWAVAAAIAAPVLAGLFTALGESHRSIWELPSTTPAAAIGEALDRYASIPFLVSPGAGLGGPMSVYGTWFPGVVGLVGMALAIVGPRHDRRTGLLLAALVVIPIVDFVATVAWPLQTNLGPLATFQFVRVRHLVPVLVACDVAVGVHWIVGRLEPGRPALGAGRRVAVLVAVAVALGAILLQAAIAARHVIRDDVRQTVVAEGWRLATLGFGLGLVGVAGLGGVLAAAALGRPTGGGVPGAWLRHGPRIAAVLLVGSLVASQAVLARAERRLAPFGLGTWAGDLAPTAGARFVAARPGPGRVVSIGEHANRAVTAGLDTVDGYVALYPLRYHELFRLLIAPTLDADPELARYYGTWGNRAYAFGPGLDPEIARLLGVRWVLATSTPGESGTLAALGPLGALDAVERFREGDEAVFELRDPGPRTFVVHEVVELPDRAAVARALATASTAELRSRAYASRDDLAANAGVDLPTAPADSADPADPTRAELRLETPDRLVIDVETGGDGWLVVADTYAPGWHATVDGAPAPIVPVDLALRGVPVPAGTHEVELRYAPAWVAPSFALSAAALIGLLGWALLAGAAGRRRAVDGQPERSGATSTDPSSSA